MGLWVVVVDVDELSITKYSDPDVTHLEIDGGVEEIASEVTPVMMGVPCMVVVIILVDFDRGAGVVSGVFAPDVTLDHVLIFPNCSPPIPSSSLSEGLLFSVVLLVGIGVVLLVTGFRVVVRGGIRGVLLGHFRLRVTGVVARLSLPPLLSTTTGMSLLLWVWGGRLFDLSFLLGEFFLANCIT